MLALALGAALSLCQALTLWILSDVKSDVREVRAELFKIETQQGYSVTMRGTK